MTMQRLEAFGKVWNNAPPEYVSLARITNLLKAFMGVKEKHPLGAPDTDAAQRLINLSEIEE